MRKLINCHYKYFMTKTNIVSFGIVLGIILLGYLLSIDKSNYDIVVINYYHQAFFITKLLVILIISFVCSYNILLKNDQYSYLVLSSGYTRWQYLLSKIITILVMVFYFVLWLLIIFLFIGTVLIKQFVFKVDYLLMYLKILLIGIIYGLYSMLLTQIINNIFSCLIVFTINLISDMIIEENLGIIEKGIYLLFPNINFSNDRLIFGYSHLVVLVIILVLGNLLVYFKKDLA